MLAIRVEKTVAKIRWPVKDAVPANNEKKITYFVSLAITGNSEITAKYVVIILGLEIKTKKACLKADTVPTPLIAIIFVEDEIALYIYL